jgi:hypothetical protein
MKITTRAVFDMTDPAFWDGDMQDACVEEESFEYEGEVALCMSMHDGPGTDRDSDGGLGDMGGGNGGSDTSSETHGRNNSYGGAFSGANDSSSEYHGRNNSYGGAFSGANDASSEYHGRNNSYGGAFSGATGTDRAWSISQGWHDVSTRAVKPSRLGGFMTTSYGYRHPDEAARQYSEARARQKTDARSMMSEIPQRIQSKWANNPAMQARLTDALSAGKIGDLTAAGVLSRAEAEQMTNTFGGGLDRIGQAVGMAPADLDMPEEAYVTGLDKGLIDPDGNLTGKGALTTYGGLAGLAAGPVAGAIMSATGSLPAALTGYAGLQLGSGYARSKGMAGSATSEALGMASSLAGAPGMITDNLAQAANMAGLARAANYGQGEPTRTAGPETRDPGSGSDENMFADLTTSGPTSAPAAAAAANEPNNFTLYKNAQSGPAASSGSGATGFLPGVSPAVSNMFDDLMV